MTVYCGEEPTSHKEGDIWISHPMTEGLILVEHDRYSFWRNLVALIKGETE